MNRDIVIGISGASGVGKTTLLRNMAILPNSEDYEIRTWSPEFITTRPRRLSDKDREIYCVSPHEFAELERKDELILKFEAHEYKYGLRHSNKRHQNEQSSGKRIVYAQVAHPDIGGILKTKLASTHDVKICMLVASSETIYSRLMSRDDGLSSEELVDRQKMAKKPIPSYVDFTIDAEQEPHEVLNKIIQIIRSLCRPSSLRSNTMITNKEKEIIQKVIEIGRQESIAVCAFGGLAANIYGSDRHITDLDFLTDCENFSWLFGKLKFDDVHESDEIITVGRVDIRRCPIKIGQQGQMWRFDNESRKRLKPATIDGLTINVLSVEDKIVMKATLQRGEEQGKFDISDLRNMLSHYSDALDKDYVIYRANACNALERVTECLSKNGYTLAPSNHLSDDRDEKQYVRQVKN